MHSAKEHARRASRRRLRPLSRPRPPTGVGAPPEDTGWLSTLRAIAAFGSPLAIGTVLLFYFGWVRTRRQALALGYDTTVLDMTTTDYVLKSVNVLFVPLVALLVLTLGLTVLHRRLLDRYDAERADGPWPPSWVAVLQNAWLGWPVLGLVLFLGLPAVPEIGGLVIPTGITLAITTYLYGRVVLRHFDPDSGRPPAGGRALLLTLLVFALFWDTERVARIAGDLYAQDIAARPDQLPRVTVFSKQRLLLDGPHVTEQAVGDGQSAYAYRYSGLHLLQRNGDRYFLLSVDGTPDTGRLAVLKDGEGMRIELGR